MRRTIFFSLLLGSVVVSQLLDARITRHWTYQEMFDKADLVVIGTALSTKTVVERTTLPDYAPLLNVIGVVTQFETRIVLKGATDNPKFLLFYYRYESEDDEFATANMPELIKIRSGTQPTFLLFLTKERNGTYVPLTGQTDPAALSVLDLRGGAD